MKPRPHLLAPLVLTACLLLTASVVSGCASRTGSDSKLNERLAAAVDEGPGTQFYMRDLTDFTWHKLYVFALRTAQAKIDAALGFAWPRPAAIGAGDATVILAFVADGRVVRYALPSRSGADFAGLVSGSPYVRASQPWTPGSALFRIGPDRKVQQGYVAP